MIHINNKSKLEDKSRNLIVSRSLLIMLAVGITMFLFGQVKAQQLESWQSCCGAVCLRTVSGLLGESTGLAEIRELLQPNSMGETSLAGGKARDSHLLGES